MIKENDLVPGRVITSIERRWSRDGEVQIITAWLIIGFMDLIRRRHSRKSAPREGWHVLLLKFGGGERILNDVTITPSEMSTNKWKRLF